MSTYGQVYVQGNRYRLKGSFHHLSPNMPIRNADEGWRLMGVTNPRDMTYIHAYGAESIFFESLGKGRLLASRCDCVECGLHGMIFLPFRSHCPGCLTRNSVVDITEVAKTSAKIYTYMVCERSGAFNLLDKPIRFINVRFDGVATILMSYLSVGTPEIGVPVVPIFRSLRPTFTILDLSWVVAGTDEKRLPEGFSF